MATEVIRIVVETRGAKEAAQSVRKIGTEAKRSGPEVDFLKRALGALSVGLVTRQFVRFSDSVTNLRNRLAILTDSTSAITSATAELFDIADRTRSNFDTTAQVYSRLALSARQLGESQSELLAITESINQAVILSGSSSREAANGLIQLSQAIASNRLGGDELRSVLEQLPLVADIVGKRLVEVGLATRGTRGEVRALGFEGKITARILIDAFKDARDELIENFGKTIPTIGQNLERVLTATVRFVSDFNDGTNAAGALGNAIGFLADNFDTLARSAAAAALAFGAIKLTAFLSGLQGVALILPTLGQLFFILPRIIGAFASFTGVLGLVKAGVAGLAGLLGALISPISLLIGLVTALGIGYVTFGDKIGLSTRGVTDFTEANKELNDALRDQEAGKLTADESKRLVQIKSQIESIESILQRNEEKGFIGRLLGGGVRGDEVKKLRSRLGRLTTELTEFGRVKPTEEVGLDEKNRLAKLAEIKRRLQEEGEVLKLNRREREIGNEVLRIRNQLKGTLSAKEENEVRTLIEANIALERQNSLYEEINDPLLDYQERQEDLKALFDAQKISLITFNEQLQLSKLEYIDSLDPLRDYTKLVTLLQDAADEGIISLSEFRKRLLEVNQARLDQAGTVSAGIKSATLGIATELQDITKITADFTTSMFQRMEDSLVSFVETGKLNFSDLANSIVSDLIRIAVQQAIIRPFAEGFSGQGATGGGLFGGLFGSVGGALGGLGKNQNGSDFRVGGSGGTDSQLVAFRATPGERVTVQTNDDRAGSRRPVSVTFNVQTPDVQSFGRSQGQLATQAAAAAQRAQRRNG